MSDSPFTETVTPGKTAPLVSVTVPVRVAVWPICARAIEGLSSNATASSVSNFIRIKSHSLIDGDADARPRVPPAPTSARDYRRKSAAESSKLRHSAHRATR
jgi:hypothetical protein